MNVVGKLERVIILFLRIMSVYLLAIVNLITLFNYYVYLITHWTFISTCEANFEIKKYIKELISFYILTTLVSLMIGYIPHIGCINGTSQNFYILKYVLILIKYYWKLLLFMSLLNILKSLLFSLQYWLISRYATVALNSLRITIRKQKIVIDPFWF